MTSFRLKQSTLPPTNVPTVGGYLKDQLSCEEQVYASTGFQPPNSPTPPHVQLSPAFDQEAGCEPAEIVDADLCLMDAQAGNSKRSPGPAASAVLCWRGRGGVLALRGYGLGLGNIGTGGSCPLSGNIQDWKFGKWSTIVLCLFDTYLNTIDKMTRQKRSVVWGHQGL